MIARIGILTAMLLLAAGCQQEPKIVSGQAKLPGDEDSAGFLDRISSNRNVSQNDAMRGVLLLINNDKDEASDFAQRVHSLSQRKVVPACWAFDALRPITKGELAYMMYQACHVHGGVTLTLIGPTQRYCLRELQYQRFMTDGSVFDKVTGMEFVAVIKRAQGYIETGEVPNIMATYPEGT